jgi:hypothetical protein
MDHGECKWESKLSNKSQTNASLKDYSATMTGSAVRVIVEDETRGALLMMNCAANDILIYFAPAGNNGTTPTITAGAAGVYTLAKAAGAGQQGGSYEPDGGFVPTNEIWAKGTNGDILVVSATTVA